MDSKPCKECGQDKPLTEYPKRSDAVGKWRNTCKECGLKKAKAAKRIKKEKLVEYKGGACEHCGGVFHPVLYDFHHTNPEEKSFSIGEHLNRSWEALTTEVDKCLLLCAHCHRMEHYNNA
jgi:hypothetical protein